MPQKLKEEILKNLQKDAFYIKLRIIPKSNKNEIIEKMADDAWKIRIAAPAEKNKANLELVSFLSKIVGIDKSLIKIISGSSDRTKLIKISKPKC